jgi:hypothetical protein
VPIVCAARAIRFFTKLAERRGACIRIALRKINGVPAAVVELAVGRAGEAPRTVMRVELASDGRIREIQSILATRKLSAIAPISA